MKIERIVQRRITRKTQGVDIAADFGAAIAANVGERGTAAAGPATERPAARVSHNPVLAAQEGQKMDRDVAQPKEEVSQEELEELDCEPLPNREVMSILPIADPIGGWATLPVEPPDAVV